MTSKVPSAEVGSAPTDPGKLKQSRPAMQELIQFRHDLASQFVSDYISNAMVEKGQIRDIEVLLDGKAGTNQPLLQDDAD